MAIGPREVVLLGRAIVFNGDFTAYVCDSAATWPSSQITSGRLVIILDIHFQIALTYEHVAGIG